MRITIAIAVLLSFITSAAVNGADKPIDVQKASDLLTRSRAVVTLGNDVPFRMEATVHAVDENGHPEDGAYNIVWESPDRFREEIILGNFQQTRVVNGGQEWLKRSLTYVPLRIIQLRDLLPSSPNFAGVRVDYGVALHREALASSKALCINGESDNRNNTICIDEQTAEPIYIKSDSLFYQQHARMEFLDYASFGNTEQIPRTIAYFIDGKNLVEVHIVKLEGLNTSTMASSAIFAPLDGIQAIPACASVDRPKGSGISRGFNYDPGETDYQGFGVVGADGKLRDLQTIHSVDTKTDAAAAVLLNKTSYTPATCKGHPVEQETLLFLDPETIAMEAVAPRAGIGGYGDVHCIYCPQPQYTSGSVRARVQGTVVLKCVISAEGKAKNIGILHSLSKDLDPQAIKAVQQWRFQPATGPDGKPADTYDVIEVTFRILN